MKAVFPKMQKENTNRLFFYQVYLHYKTSDRGTDSRYMQITKQ